MEGVEEVDLSKITAQFFIRDHISRMRKIISVGKSLRATFSEEQKAILEETHTNPELDDINIAFAISKMSSEAIHLWESNLKLVEDCISEDVESLLNHEDCRTITLFLALMATFKGRSRRHLDNFLEAFSDGEWVDAIIVGKGQDSEFRTVDHCSEEARAEFGLKK